MPSPKTAYVDGYVLVVPKTRVAEYKKMAASAKKIWMKLGALDYKECILDDNKPFKEIVFPFMKMAQAKPSETVWFSYVTYKSKAHRDKVNKQVHAAMEKAYGDKADSMKDMPWDMKRFAYGGFKVMV